ncbi:MAG: sulfurtransferase TusA family protein [bacterium]|nr:sulfurtransferase TusA family protein [bacterium]
MNVDETLDLYGLICPLPIAETAKKVKTMKSGQILEIIATDEGIEADFPSWCENTGHELIKIEKDEKEGTFKIYLKIK